jgi:hypothetical protein
LAIYHFQMKTLSRSSGRSATAAAAYRAGQKIEDERTGQTYDYSKRSGVLLAEVILPDGGQVDRSQLWNVAEAAEKRCNSVVAREFVVALPHELNLEQQTDLVRGYAQGVSERTGWAVDVAIHAPGKEGDLRNTHAHLLCTTRTIERDPAGCPVAGSKTRGWDIRSSGSVLLRSERSEWERCVNQSLEQANRMERVDCRSHAEKQTGLEPQIHLGPTAMNMERKGMQTERGDEHRRIAAHNANVIELERLRAKQEKEAAWAKELKRLESLSLYDLEREAKQHEPGTARSIAFENPEVQAAYEPLRRYDWYNRLPHYEALAERELYETGKRGWLNEDMLTTRKEAVDRASTALVWANRDEQAWREAHPVKAALFDLGLPNSELKALTQARETAQANHANEEKALEIFVQERKAAKEKLEAAIQKALPEAERLLPERQARFAEIQAILAPKREAAREQARQRELERSQEQGGGGRSMGW